jgi:hypothetical protein
MTERNHKLQGEHWQRERDGLDRELDAALAKYASVEPRAGLEARILANLRAEDQPVLQRGFWRPWTVATAAATALVLILVWSLSWKSEKLERNRTAQRPAQRSLKQSATKQPATTAQFSSPGLSTGEGSEGRPRKSDARRAHPSLVVTDQPKLDQFPSPQPLSEQEQMLASYVAKYPETAVLVAQARAEALRRDLKEQADWAAQGSVQ